LEIVQLKHWHWDVHVVFDDGWTLETQSNQPVPREDTPPQNSVSCFLLGVKLSTCFAGQRYTDADPVLGIFMLFWTFVPVGHEKQTLNDTRRVAFAVELV
jgi:hypothetical protein